MEWSPSHCSRSYSSLLFRCVSGSESLERRRRSIKVPGILWRAKCGKAKYRKFKCSFESRFLKTERRCPFLNVDFNSQKGLIDANVDLKNRSNFRMSIRTKSMVAHLTTQRFVRSITRSIARSSTKRSITRSKIDEVPSVSFGSTFESSLHFRNRHSKIRHRSSIFWSRHSKSGRGAQFLRIGFQLLYRCMYNYVPYLIAKVC